MAHSRSALKRWRQSLQRRNRNRSVKSETRTLLTKAIAAISDDASAAEDAVRTAVAALDRAAQKGVIHSNAAARSKSRILKRYNLGVASSVAAAAGATPEAAPDAKPKRAPRATKATPPAAEKKPAPRPRTKKTS